MISIIIGVNWIRDTSKITSSDLRNVITGDPSPDGKGKIEIKRGIEVGHIFSWEQSIQTL